MFCSNEKQRATRRRRPGCVVAYRLGRERLLLQAAAWSLGCSNFDRFLHKASKLGSKLCSTISNHPSTRKQSNNTYQVMHLRLLTAPVVIFASGVTGCW
jgi:hypothetical protein